jgi:signal transduction histidine kinase
VSWFFKSARESELEHQASRLEARIVELEKSVACAQARLEALIEAFPQPTWVLGSDLHPRYWNRALVVLSRKEEIPSEELKRLSIHAWFREPEVARVFERAQAAGQSCLGLVALEGRVFELSCSPWDSGWIAVFHDVTQLKRAEQARVDLVVNVSHELRTPLTAIKGFSDTLVEDLRAERYEECASHVAVIERNVARLIDLSREVLEVSTLASEEGLLERQIISVREVTEKALQALEPELKRSGHRVVPAYEIERVFAHGDRVEQVLLNLLGNALRYVPAQSGAIEVLWRAGASPGEGVLEVVDHGPGIPEEIQPRIFERFFRGDSDRSRDSGGAGLGLSIVKHILLRHGGSVSVESRLGQGTRLICRFPAPSA